MGASSSCASEACGESESPDGDATGSQSSNCGFSRQETHHLTALRRLVRREQEPQMPNLNYLALIWRCSRLLALNSQLKSPLRPSGNVANLEAHLAQHSPSQLELVQKRCRQFDALLAEFSSMIKMNASLEKLFVEDDRFLEMVANMLGLQGHKKDSVEFVCNALCEGEESFSAKHVIELCFHTASVLHYLQEDHEFDNNAPDLIEQRNVSGESKIVQSMADSLLEYAKDSRENYHFGGYVDAGASSGAAANTPDGNITKREFSEWQQKVVPDLIYCSITRFQHILLFPSTQQRVNPFPSLRSSKDITSQATTKLKDDEITPISSYVFGKNFMSSARSSATSLLSPAVFPFVSISVPKFGDTWYRIFAGVEDGWTFQQLEHSIMGYEGPTLIVIQGHSRNKNDRTVTLGAYTASKWEKNKRGFHGTSDCFLFRLDPTLRVFKTLPKMGKRGGHYMFYHSNTNKTTSNPARTDDLAQGLGFGGTVRHPRLFIDSRLEECHVSHQDTSFEEGYIAFEPSSDPFSSNTSSSTVLIDSLEIYAVGDEDTIRRGFRSQYQHRDIADATLRKARTVDKAAFLGDMRNGIIESKAFAHRGQVDGRAHGCLKGEDDRKANDL